MHAAPSLPEILGLTPWRARLREAAFALRGDPLTPATRWGPSSLRVVRPALSYQLWRGRRPAGRRVVMYNLFNHTPTPEAEGWSVRKTQVQDFRGGDQTYDSHNGTDFATPPGTVVVAPAAGRVAVVVSEFHRGGLKVMIDHGDGLCTMVGHLARALVAPGEDVARGQPVALSGASGLNFVGSLLADPPHVHMNVWLDGVPVDPFARPGEASLWRDHNDPTPAARTERGGATSAFDPERVAAWLAACRDPALRARLEAIEDPWRRACEVMFAANYYPTRFATRVRPSRAAAVRAPRLDLPFAAHEYDGIDLDPVA